MSFLSEFYMHEMNMMTVLIRLLLAVILGGIIGLERGANKHPAGFRTHILVCLGATLAMLTNEYIYHHFEAVLDPGRLGAQVITGVGFLGVGIILVTGRNKIKGLTTAAGLWASACIGLAIGIGFYAGAIISGILVLVTLAVFPRVENMLYLRSRTLSIYVEVDAVRNVKPLLNAVKAMGITVMDAHLDRVVINVEGAAAVSMMIKLPKKCHVPDALKEITELPYVIIVDELI
ncbi:MAG: MgtC/SapB family protein [Clostridiales bacterium]|nr:MgtC/SapB family protein [Clostridiales bacterium]